MRFRAAILAVFLSLGATPAFSQGCAMCYSSAKAASTEGQRAISKAVVVLLFPPAGFMTLGVWMAFRYGKKRDLEQNRSSGLKDLRKLNPKIRCTATEVHHEVVVAGAGLPVVRKNFIGAVIR